MQAAGQQLVSHKNALNNMRTCTRESSHVPLSRTTYVSHVLLKKALNMRTNTLVSSSLSPHNCKICHTNVHEYTCTKFICISYLHIHMYTLIHTYTHTYTYTLIHMNLYPCPCHEPRIWVTNYIHKSCRAMACKSKNAHNERWGAGVEYHFQEI